MQGAVNGLLRPDIGAPLAVSVVSFVVATVAMLIVVAVVRLRSGGSVGGAGFAAMPWWGWLGALCGATYVTTVFTAIPVIGASATVGLTVLGQQAASLLVDQYGLLRLPPRRSRAAHGRRGAADGRRAGAATVVSAGVQSPQDVFARPCRNHLVCDSSARYLPPMRN